MSTSIFSVGQVTSAMRARELLSSHGIHCEIIKLDPKMTPNGCSYGVKVSAADRHRTARILGSSAHYLTSS
jgi:hypothetical protein